MVSAAEYALRLANGEPLESILNEVWRDGIRSDRSSDVSPFAGETASK